MPAKNGNITTITPKAYDPLVKFITVERTDTTPFVALVLPKNATPVGLYVIGTDVSNAGTSADLSLGTTSSADEVVAAFDVTTAATSTGYFAVGATVDGTFLGTKLTADTPVYAAYTEAGTASTTGGPWYFKLEYLLTGPGETV